MSGAHRVAPPGALPEGLRHGARQAMFGFLHLALAAPSMCPCWALVLLTGTLSAAAPRTLRRDATSTGSPVGVAVAWALM